MLRQMPHQVSQSRGRGVRFKAGNTLQHSFEVARLQQLLQVSYRLRAAQRCGGDGVFCGALCVREAFAQSRQHLRQFDIKKVLDPALVAACAPGQLFNVMQTHRVKVVRASLAQGLNLLTDIRELINLRIRHGVGLRRVNGVLKVHLRRGIFRSARLGHRRHFNAPVLRTRGLVHIGGNRLLGTKSGGEDHGRRHAFVDQGTRNG